jgi:hypothetical protein
MVNTYLVQVRRDTYTTTPTVVTEYEAKILQEIHGDANVLNDEGKAISEGMGKAIGSHNPPADEYQRLIRRYGAKNVGAVIGKEANLKKILNPRQSRKQAQTEVAEKTE